MEEKGTGMSFPINGQGRGYGDYSRMGPQARNAAQRLDAMRKGQQNAATTGTGEADDTAGSNAAATTGQTETPAAVEQKANQKYPGASQLFAGLRRQADDFFNRVGGLRLNGGSGTDVANTGATDAAEGSSSMVGDFFDQLAAMFQNATGATAGSGSAGGSGSYYEETRVQFELNLSVVQTVATAQGLQETQVQMGMKIDMSWISAGSTTGWGDTGQTTSTDTTGAANNNPFAGLSATNPMESGITAFLKSIATGGMGGLGSLFGTGSTTGTDPMANLQDYYSPEKTAERILNFATAFYPGSKYAKDGDTEESRQAFADEIGKAIQKGFDQAMGVLGKVDDKTQSGIDKTHDIVFKGLDDFVKNGLGGQSAEKQVAQDYTQSWFQQLSLSVSYSRTTTTYSSTGQTGAANTSSTSPLVNAEA